MRYTLPKVQSSQHRFFCWNGCLKIIGWFNIQGPDVKSMLVTEPICSGWSNLNNEKNITQHSILRPLVTSSGECKKDGFFLQNLKLLCMWFERFPQNVMKNKIENMYKTKKPPPPSRRGLNISLSNSTMQVAGDVSGPIVPSLFK